MRRRTKRRLRDIDRPIVDLATHPTPAVTPAVLAAYGPIDCDERTIIKMAQAGALVGYKVGREWRITVLSARRAFPVETHVAHRAAS